jgi:Rhodopirellula transposase DDE domain
MPIIDEVQTTARYLLMSPHLDEKQRRLWVACEAMNSGYGAISALSRATGIHRKTIRSGIADLSPLSPQKPDTGKQRRLGAGRKPLTAHSPQLAKALDALMEPYTSGDPMRPLRWTCKSTHKLAAELTSQGFKISARSISMHH